MLKHYKTTFFLIAGALALLSMQSCSKQSYQSNSNKNNFEDQDFMASRAVASSESNGQVSLPETTPVYVAPQQTEVQNNTQQPVAGKVKAASSKEQAPAVSKKEMRQDLKKLRKEIKDEIKKEADNKDSGKSQVIALILVLLVGSLGIHRFYLGYTAIGVIQLLTLGGCGIWALIDLIRIAVGDLQPKDGEYTETL